MGRKFLEPYDTIDFLVIGEGESIFKELCSTLLEGKIDKLNEIEGIIYREKGGVIVNKPKITPCDIDSIPFPRWDLIDNQRYIGVTGKSREIICNGIEVATAKRHFVIFSRGCVGRCHFCSSWWIWKKHRSRSPQNMYDELKLLYDKYETRCFTFLDDCFTANKQAVIELCNLIIKNNLKITFSCITRTDLLDEELVSKLKQTGCYEISFGVESGDSDILSEMNKNNTLEQTITTFGLLKKYHILSTAFMMVGNPNENYKTINNTIRFLKKIKPDLIGTEGGLQIYPGTRIYNYCKEKGYIDDSFWLSKERIKIYDFEFTPLLLKSFEIAVRKKIYLTPFKWLNYFYIFTYNFLINKKKGLLFRFNKLLRI